MNTLNFAVIVPMPIHHSGGGDIIWEKAVILGVLIFVFFVLPFLIYLIKEYLKHKRKYPELYFYWGDYPLSIIIVGGYVTVFVAFLVLLITEVIYELMF